MSRLEQIPPEDNKHCEFRDKYGECLLVATGKQRVIPSLPWQYVCDIHFTLGLIAGIEQQNFNEELRIKPIEQILGEGIAGEDNAQ